MEYFILSTFQANCLLKLTVIFSMSPFRVTLVSSFQFYVTIKCDFDHVKNVRCSFKDSMLIWVSLIRLLTLLF